MTHPDLPAEQAHVDHAYARLAAMRAAASAMLRDAFGERGGTFQAVTERDIRVRTSLSRLEQLEIGAESLVFGRIDRQPEDDHDASGESFHIGRIAVSDEDQEPLVVDWRAPIAEPFYRATGAHPMSLRRRRHFLAEGHRVLDLEDEWFDGDGLGSGLGLSGPQVLLATLERSRTGRMRDIVATVQREQDEIIRGALPGILVVQGGPGTGKTAVALHRAAYLLYTHRFPLEGQGVLVVGPNPTFLRYIEHVLPSLDESGVELSTVNGLFGRQRPTGDEEDDVARLKGDARMARVIARAVANRQRPLRRAIEIPFGTRVLRVSPEMSSQLVAAAKRRAGTHNARRRTLEALLWRQMLDQITPESGPDAGDLPAAPELGRMLRRQPETMEALERMWPVLTPQQLLHDLFGARPLIELAASDVLTSTERALLERSRTEDPAQVRWTDADIALLDEAYALLGPPTRRATADGSEVTRTYGHVVVDEAQDLSPMQLRMVGRRSLSGSMTVVGDLAQATGGWTPATWGQVAEHLPSRRSWRLVELTVNYRTPSEIMSMASRVLEHVSPGVRPPDAVRSSPSSVRIVPVSSTQPTFSADTLAGPTLEVLRQVLAEGEGTVAVVAAPSLLDGVAAAVEAGGITVGRVGGRALDEQVTVLAVEDAKGLEFDSVIVVEPARIASEAKQRLRALYVAFTRATQRLVIVHAQALPAPIAAVAQNSA